MEQQSREASWETSDRVCVRTLENEPNNKTNRTNKKRHRTNGILPSPELSSMTRADPIGNRHGGRYGNRGTRGGKRASREEAEVGRQSGSGEGATRRGVSGGGTRGAEKRVQRRHPKGPMEEGTAGRSPERKEAALHYRLQMAAATRTVAGELEGARTMEWLRGIAATAGTLLS